MTHRPRQKWTSCCGLVLAKSHKILRRWLFLGPPSLSVFSRFVLSCVLVCLLQTFDTNCNGVLDRTEFTAFVQQFTTNVTAQISLNIVIFALLAPGLAILTKGATEQVPVLGKVVKKTPNAVYASVITALLALAGKVGDRK